MFENLFPLLQKIKKIVIEKKKSISPNITSFKVARVINTKLGFMDWILYYLITLIK